MDTDVVISFGAGNIDACCPALAEPIKNEKLNIKNTGICFWHFRFRLELMRSLLLDKNDFLRGLESA